MSSTKIILPSYTTLHNALIQDPTTKFLGNDTSLKIAHSLANQKVSRTNLNTNLKKRVKLSCRWHDIPQRRIVSERVTQVIQKNLTTP